MPFMLRRTWLRGQTPQIVVTTNVEEWARHLRPQELVLLVGAGVSCDAPTGLPTARAFLSELYRLTLPESVECPLLFDPLYGPRFELVLDVLRRAFDSNLTLLHCFARVEPNENHRCLATLARQGAVLVTTNFDVMLERALSVFGDARSYYLPRDFDSGESLLLSATPSVWHLHGAVEDHLSGEIRTASVIASIGDVLTQRHQLQLGGAKFRFLCQALEGRDLVVVGYSGSDDYDITQALIDVPGIRSVTWVVHSSPDAVQQHGTTVSSFEGNEWFVDGWAAVLAAWGEDGFPPPTAGRGLVADTRRALRILANQFPSAPDPPPPPPSVDWKLAIATWAEQRFAQRVAKYHFALTLSRACGLSATERRIAEAATACGDGGVDRRWAVAAVLDATMHGAPVAADWVTGHVPAVLPAVSVGLAKAWHKLAHKCFEQVPDGGDFAEVKALLLHVQSALDDDPDPWTLGQMWLLLAKIAEREHADVASMDEVFERALRAAFDSGSHELLARTYALKGIHLLKHRGDERVDVRLGDAVGTLAEAFRLLRVDGDPELFVQVAPKLGFLLDSWPGQELRGLRAHAQALLAAATCGFTDIQKSAEDHLRARLRKFGPDLETSDVGGTGLANRVLSHLDKLPDTLI